jgi:hypothetical protein
VFRCSKSGLIADILAQSRFKNIAVQYITCKADYADNNWQNMMDVADPAMPDKTNEAVKAVIKNDIYAMINAKSTNGRPLPDFGAIFISGEEDLLRYKRFILFSSF